MMSSTIPDLQQRLRLSVTPIVPQPREAEAIDALARRAREFLETVTAGLQAQAPK